MHVITVKAMMTLVFRSDPAAAGAGVVLFEGAVPTPVLDGDAEATYVETMAWSSSSVAFERFSTVRT
jgi:hypothetical protein